MKRALLAASAALLFLSGCGSGKPSADAGTPVDAGTGGGAGGGAGGGTGDGGRVATAAETAAAQAHFECRVMECLFTLTPDFCAQLSGPGVDLFGTPKFDTVFAWDAGRLAYDEARGTACRDALLSLDGLSCFGPTAPLFTAAQAIQEASGAVRPCDGVFTGTVPNGSPCYDNLECEFGWCDFGSNACPGTCTARRRLGDPCDRDVQCETGACGDTGAGMACAPRSPSTGKGGDCSGGQACDTGLYCDATGICTDVKRTDGLSCKSDVECGESSFCRRASLFDNTGTCTAKSAEAGACDIGGLFFFPLSPMCQGAQVCAGLVMDGGSVAQQGRCQVPGDVGAPCFPDAETLGANGCYLDLVCSPVTARCVPLPGVGTACIEERCGQDAYCDASGTCAAKKPDGAACTTGDECLNDCDASSSPGTCHTPPDTPCVP